MGSDTLNIKKVTPFPQPDWAEKKAKRYVEAQPSGKFFDMTPSLAKLLRAEHQWAVKIVKTERADYVSYDDAVNVALDNLTNNILAKLTKGRA